jgi:hypothetical protein
MAGKKKAKQRLREPNQDMETVLRRLWTRLANYYPANIDTSPRGLFTEYRTLLAEKQAARYYEVLSEGVDLFDTKQGWIMPADFEDQRNYNPQTREHDDPSPYKFPTKDRYVYLPKLGEYDPFTEVAKFQCRFKKGATPRSITVYRLRKGAFIEDKQVGITLLVMVENEPSFWTSEYYREHAELEDGKLRKYKELLDTRQDMYEPDDGEIPDNMVTWRARALNTQWLLSKYRTPLPTAAANAAKAKMIKRLAKKGAIVGHKVQKRKK